ncbi:hypothetical protein HWI79_2677 [Cryptosporidium felis]|nr:hypothetical protein HWI79_2677 [Cryptosporidium felis]
MQANKRRQKRNKEFSNSWPLPLEHTLLESLTKNVHSKETEFLEEVKLYMHKSTESSSQNNKNLNSLILQVNDRYPAESFISKLYANPHSILFLYNIIPPLLTCSDVSSPYLSKERVEVLSFVLQLLFKSLIKHCQVILSIDRRLDNSLVNLSMSLTQHLQTVFSGYEELILMMSYCTSLLIILSNNSLSYIQSILSNTEIISVTLSRKFDRLCKAATNETILQKQLFEGKGFWDHPFHGNAEIGSFVSHLRYIDGIASLYLLNVERPNFFAPNRRAIISEIVSSMSIGILRQLEEIIKFYLRLYRSENNMLSDYSLFYEGKTTQLKFVDFISPVVIQASLKWIEASQEIDIKRYNEFPQMYFDISRFPDIFELGILPIKRDQISKQILYIILDFMESYSGYLNLGTKYSVPNSVISKNLLTSSMILSNSITKSSTTFFLRDEISFLDTNLNWLKILTSYFQIFSHSIVPMLLIFDLLDLPLNSELDKPGFEDPYLLHLYQEWLEIQTSAFIDIVFETISKTCKISKVNKTTFSAPIMITYDSERKRTQSHITQKSPFGTIFVENTHDDLFAGFCQSLEIGSKTESVLNSELVLSLRESFDKLNEESSLFHPDQSFYDASHPIIVDFSHGKIPDLEPKASSFVSFSEGSSSKVQAVENPELKSFTGKDSSQFIFQKYRHEIHNLMCCLSLITLGGSSEYVLFSISAWGSICSSLRVSSSCVSYLQSLLTSNCRSKFKPLEEWFSKIRSRQENFSCKLGIVDEIGLVGIQRYFVWSIVELGEFPNDLYNFEDHSEAHLMEFSKKKSSHLKVRESIRDAVRNAIFFPELPNDSVQIGQVDINSTSYLLPFYSFQMFLKDVYLYLNGYSLVDYRLTGKVGMSRRKQSTGNVQIKSMIIRLESVLHAFSAIIKKGLTSFSLKGNVSGRSNYGSQDEIKELLDKVCLILNLDDEEAINKSFNDRRSVLGERIDYFESTRLLFDAVMLKIFQITDEFESLMDAYLQSSHQRLYSQIRVVLDENSRVYERLLRQLLCTLITLVGVSSVWFNNKSILVTLKGLKYIFRSLLLIQEDHFFPLALEQDHVGALALLKLSQNKTYFESEILDYMVLKCMDIFSRLFSGSDGNVEIPTMTFESYLILLTSLGICISHLISDTNNSQSEDGSNYDIREDGGLDRRHGNITSNNNNLVNANFSSPSSASANMQKWKKYTGLVLNNYMSLMDKILKIFNIIVADCERRASMMTEEDISNDQINQMFNLLLVTYILFCGLEAFFSSIFPCKYRPFSYVILAIGAEKFSHMNILDYSKKLFDTESTLRSCNMGRVLKEASNYVMGFFSKEFYSRIRLILRLSSAISPKWLQVLYHPYTCIISCLLQLPLLNVSNTINDGGRDYLLGLYRYIGYDEFQFLSRDTCVGGGTIGVSNNANSTNNVNVINSGVGFVGGGPGMKDLLHEGGKCNCFSAGQDELLSSGIIKKGLHPIITLIYKSLLYDRGLNFDLSSVTKLLQCSSSGNCNSSINPRGLGSVMNNNPGSGMVNNGDNNDNNDVNNGNLKGGVQGYNSKYFKEIFNILKKDLIFFDKGKKMGAFDNSSVNDNNTVVYDKNPCSNNSTNNINSNSISSNNNKLCICSYVPNIFLPLSVMMIRIPYLPYKMKQRFLDPTLSFIHLFKIFNVHPIIQFLGNYSVSVSTLTSFNRDDYRIQQDLSGITGGINGNNNYRYFNKDSGLQDINRLNTFCMYINQVSNIDGNVRGVDSRIDDHCSCLEYHDGVCLTMLLLLQNLTNISTMHDFSSSIHGVGGNLNSYNSNISFIKVVGTSIRINIEVFIEYVITRCIITLLICIGMQSSSIKKYYDSLQSGSINVGTRSNSDSNINVGSGVNNMNTISHGFIGSGDGKMINSSSIIGTGKIGCDFNIDNNNHYSMYYNPFEDIKELLQADNSTSTMSTRSVISDNNATRGLILDNELRNGNNLSYLVNGGNIRYDKETESINKNVEFLRNIKEVERFIPQKLLSNQRWVVITIKYLLGEFATKVNRSHLEKLFTNSVWGVEFTATILIAILESYCDSESFSILSDILILIRQLLDKKKFKHLLETTFCRLPVRILIQSVQISGHYSQLYFPLVDGVKTNGVAFNGEMENNTLTTNNINNFNLNPQYKSRSSLITFAVRNFVNDLLEENFCKNVNIDNDNIKSNCNNSLPQDSMFSFQNYYSSKNLNFKFQDPQSFVTRYCDDNDNRRIFDTKNPVLLPYVLKSSYSSEIIRDFIQQLVNVSVSQTNKTKFRQILKEFCIKSVSKRVGE